MQGDVGRGPRGVILSSCRIMRFIYRTFHWLRDSFLAGLLVLLPVGLTLYVLWLLYRLIYSFFGPETAFARFLKHAIGHYIPGIEFLITGLVVVAVGALSRMWFGRKIYQLLERLILTVPGVRKLYWGMRQLAHAVLRRNSQRNKLRRVVLFEYPREGMYVLGFVTNDDVGEINRVVGKECLSVYAPTAPNPLSGWVFFVPKERLIELDLPVDEGLSMILSGGIVFPEKLRRRDADLEGREREA